MPTYTQLQTLCCGAGLRPQHLTGLQLIAELGSGSLQGGAVGSTCISLATSSLMCGTHVADTRTAGSCMLLAQSALPCLLFATPAAGRAGEGERAGAAAATGGTGLAASPAGPEDEASALQDAVQRGAASCLDLRGGTDASMAPPLAYTQHVLLPVLRSRLGVRADMHLERRGFFPKGQGHVVLRAAPLAPGTCLPSIDLTERGEIVAIAIFAFTAGRLAPSIGERLATAAQKGGGKGRGRARCYPATSWWQSWLLAGCTPCDPAPGVKCVQSPLAPSPLYTNSPLRFLSPASSRHFIFLSLRRRRLEWQGTWAAVVPG